MENYRINMKTTALITCCFLLINFMNVSADAARGSRIFAISLLTTGLGLQVGSTYMNTSAEEKYEDYLSATIQADIQSRKSVVLERQNTSIIMSRVGLGCIGLAVLISIVDQLNSSSDTVSTETAIPTKIDVISQYPSSLTSSDLGFGVYPLRSIRSENILPKFDLQAQRFYLGYTHRF